MKPAPHITTFILFALLTGATPSASASEATSLFRQVRSLDRGTAPSVAAVDWARVEVEATVLSAQTRRLALELLPGLNFTAEVDHVEVRGEGDLAWRGRLAEVPQAQVVLTRKNGFVVGAVFHPEAVYEVGTRSDGSQWVAKLDSNLFPPCGLSAAELPAAGPAMSLVRPAAPAAGRDTADRIDVMVTYTPQARDGAGGVAQIEATAQAAVDISNTAFANSDMVARFHLVHTALSSRNDSGNISSDLSWLANDSATAALRDTYAADLVSIITENGGGFCGVGYLLGNQDASAFGPSGFQLTARGCAVGNLTFPHEHGHNMGLNHDPANGLAPGSAYAPDAFGHFHNGVYRTVLSYSTQCASGCTRHPYFSNPAVTFMSLPTGILNQRDNHRVSNLTAPFVANWRESSAIFDDSFEAGSTAAWSVVSP